MNNHLKHYGILGMRWGRRKNDTPGVSRRVSRLAKKDVKRYADAKMFYGKTAGTRRKLLAAELDKKKKQIPGYETAFNKHLGDADFAKSAKKAKFERTKIDTLAKGRSLMKGILGVTGSLSVAAATMVYYANKSQIDNVVSSQYHKIVRKVKGAF